MNDFLRRAASVAETLSRRPLWLFMAFAVAVVALSLQKYLVAGTEGLKVYLIYKYSLQDLLSGANLYQAHKGLDYFLYTPTFPLLMAPCAFLPDAAGCVVWNLMSATAYFVAVWRLPFENPWKRLLILAIALPMIVTDLQNFQSNTLMAALALLAFDAFERDSPAAAAAAIALSFYVKLYGLGFAVIFLLHARRLPFIFWLGAFLALFAAAPLPAIGFDVNRLLHIYQEWIRSLSIDTSSTINAMGLLRATMGLDIPNAWAQAVSLAALACPLAFWGAHKDITYRMVYMAALMLWVVVFSHKAESPSYVIAMTGAALGFVAAPKRWWTFMLIAFCIIFTELSVTDIFPKWFRRGFVAAYGLQAAPCLVAWMVAMAWLLRIGASRLWKDGIRGTYYPSGLVKQVKPHHDSVV